jgi:two-component system, NtrC family, response regulator AtoC
MAQKRTVLIVDDEPSMRRNIADLLSEEGFAFAEAGDGLEAIEKLNIQHPDLVLLDINLPKMDGFETLREIRRLAPEAVVLMFTAHGTSERAIEAMKAGAYDYIEKPFDLDEFLILVRRALQYQDLLGEVAHLRSQVSRSTRPDTGGRLIGTSGRMQELFKLIGRVAPTDTTVLIQGESGTGKELIADAIQRHSGRKDKAFVKVNCGALPENLLESEIFGHEKGSFTGAVSQHPGRFEIADGGTLFLDEINNMPASLQMKLLRVLQQKTFERVGGTQTLTVDVRVLAGTNKDIEKEVREGRFREDLYYRLNVIHINVPPLREHPEDIPSLVDHFLQKYSHGSEVVVPPEVMSHLQRYSWPGNVRELENVVQRALVLTQGGIITPDHLPLTIRAESGLGGDAVQWQDGSSLRKVMADFERQIILNALRQTNWNRTKTAQMLQIDRRQLFSKIKEYNLEKQS